MKQQVEILPWIERRRRKSGMSEQREQGPATRTISRAIAILQAFDAKKLNLGVTDLSQLTDLDKSTVYRLLSALQQGGLIERDSQTAKYHLGFGLVRLAGLALQHLDLPRISRSYLEELAEFSKETVNLSILTEDDKIINIDGITSPRRVRNVGWIGREMPPHAVSGGKVMLAYMSEERLSEILAPGLNRYTERTITDPAVLRQQLEQIRQVGYGIAEEELEEGLSAAAAPILNLESQVQAAISVSGPSFRLPRERLVELGIATKQIADRISYQIGHTGLDQESSG
jgi:DNA-binding IclR family transcriptional regulator